MGAAREEFCLYERPARKALAHPEVRLRRAAVRLDRHALSIARVASDRPINESFIFVDAAAHEHQVALFRGAALHLALEVGHGLQRSTNHHQPARIFVESVDDAWSKIAVLRSELGKTREQPVHGRAAL